MVGFVNQRTHDARSFHPKRLPCPVLRQCSGMVPGTFIAGRRGGLCCALTLTPDDGYPSVVLAPVIDALMICGGAPLVVIACVDTEGGQWLQPHRPLASSPMTVWLWIIWWDLRVFHRDASHQAFPEKGKKQAWEGTTTSQDQGKQRPLPRPVPPDDSDRWPI